MPGIGFAGGFERLQLSLEAENIIVSELSHPFVFVIAAGKEARNKGIKLLQKVRKNGISAEAAFNKTSLKAQMKTANKSKSEYVLILGEEEILTNSVTLKNMKNGDQEQIPLDSVITKILKLSSNFS